MNPLQIRLAALRRRLRLVVTFRGVATAAALVLVVLVLGGLLDWRMHLPDLVRALILAGTLTGAGYVAYRHLLRPLWANSDDLSLALRVEERYPVLNDALASAVQFLEQPEKTDRAASASLRQEAVQRALGLAKGFNFNPVVDTRGVRTAGLSLAGAGALALILALLYPQLAQTGFLRLTHPFGGYDWPRQTQLQIQARTRVARGEAFEIQAGVSGIIPDRATVEYRFDGAPGAKEVYEITRTEGADTGNLVARLEPGRVQRNFRFQVRANDAVSRWFEVEVLPPPQLVVLGGRPSPQIHLRYPAYSDLPEQDLPDGASSVEAIAGTAVTLRAGTDRPIVRAWLEYPDELAPVVHVASGINALSGLALCNALDLAMSRPAVWKRVPARLSSDGKIFELEFIARLSGSFALHFEDELGIGNVRLIDIRAQLDPAPVVHLERPSRSQDSLDILPDAEITIHVQAADPVYALRSVYAEYSKKGSGQETSRVPFSPLRVRTQQVDISRRWALGDLKLKEGDVLTLQACAEDFDDVTVLKQPGRSQEVELRVVGKNQLDIALNEAEAQIQQELTRLQKEQQEAIEKVIPAEAQWRNKAPLQAKHLDELLQAEQIQQQIRARVGTRQEGLRAEVARIQQALRDNHLPRSARQDRMDAIANELERLSREELDQIEPRLTEARKETEMSRRSQGSEKKAQPQEPEAASAANKDRAPLPEARRHQDEVKKTLDELLKLLEPWSSSREVKGEARSILQEQTELQKQTEKLAEETRGQPVDKLDANSRAEVDRLAELQNKLAERTEQLLDKLQRLAEARPKDDADAKAMKSAAEKGQQSNAAGKMKEAANNIRANRSNEAGSQQAESKKAMEDVVKSLEDRPEEDLERLIKKMKQAEDRLADLADKQELLQKKMREAAQIADEAKREEQLKRLAREQEQLQRETQDMVRELSRLRSERASRALSQAGSQMQRAGRQMQNGQDAQEQQDEALDRLNDAQQELQQDREQAEEQLTREKLAKIADLIKGKRERQQALNAEAARIHRQVLQGKNWSDELLASFNDLADNQEQLGKETSELANDKLTGAKVFMHLLGKSAEAMQEASKRMRERLERAKERLNRNADKESNPDAAAENLANDDIQKLQQTALRRIDQVLEALKQDKGLRAGNQNSGSRGGGGGGGGGQHGGGEGDNIPPMSQLKALKALEQEIYDRTRDFHKKHPDVSKLNSKEQEALRALRREQQELTDLFRDITAPPAEPEGGKK
jgi:hypothetical protein